MIMKTGTPPRYIAIAAPDCMECDSISFLLCEILFPPLPLLHPGEHAWWSFLWCGLFDYSTIWRILVLLATRLSIRWSVYNRSPLDDGAEDVVVCLPLGNGVKLAPIFLCDEHDGDSVGSAEGWSQLVGNLIVVFVEGNVLKGEYFCLLILGIFHLQMFAWSACEEECGNGKLCCCFLSFCGLYLCNEREDAKWDCFLLNFLQVWSFVCSVLVGEVPI